MKGIPNSDFIVPGFDFVVPDFGFAGAGRVGIWLV